MNKQNAVVTLVMRGNRYVWGAIGLAISLKEVGCTAQKVVMVTPDIVEEDRDKLSQWFDHVIQVQYLRFPTGKMLSDRQKELYNWISDSYTKWRCLQLVQFNKVLFVDSDIMLWENPDPLFELPTPASVLKDAFGIKFKFFYIGKDIKHGERVSYESIEHRLEVYKRRLANPNDLNIVVVSAAMILLSPNEQVFEHYMEMMHIYLFNGPFSLPFCRSGQDEQSIYSLYKRLGQEWTNIGYRWSVIPWYSHYLDKEERLAGTHWMGEFKPWEQESSEWEDTNQWETLVKKYIPEFKRIVKNGVDGRS